MKKIIDSNYLQRDELRDYLNQSRENCAVLTDYVAMEAYKADIQSVIFKSMAILADYPSQVIVLKDTQTICGLEPQREGFQNQLIDHKQTKNFPQFCRELADAKRGSSAFTQQIAEHKKAAKLHMNKMLADTEQLREAIDAVADTYNQEELKFLRSNSDTPPDGIYKKISKQILGLAAEIFESHPKATVVPDFNNLQYSYIFRYSICSYLNVLDRVASGGARSVKPKSLRNDIVDVTFATHATFFDGILSYDKKVNQLYEETCFWLDAVFKSEGN